MDTLINVSSEIGPLKKVIVHRPNTGISRITPKRSEELLFDDIVYLPLMQEEHDVFTRVLKLFLGEENVFETTTLLSQALNHKEEAKEEMIDLIIDYEELPSSVKDTLKALPAQNLAEVLISGYYPEEDYILFDPIPNFIFTRDIAVTVNEHLIITKAAKEARFRENFLTRFIMHAHPMFDQLQEEKKLINLNHVDLFPPSRKGEVVSLEGGDAMILNEDYLLIGCSERTSAHAIKSLTKVLFEKDAISNVVQVNIPNDRSYMHLDTIFTQINHDHFVAFKPIIGDGLGSNVEVMRQNGSTAIYSSLSEFLKNEISGNIEFIWSGNGETPYQEREQWTDGCNLVALKPGVAVTYDRNPRTEKAFEEAGYQVIHATELLKKAEKGKLNVEEIENTIITLPSNELSRARGGSHCMTCPIERGKI